MGNHYILGQAIAVKKALEREQKELIASGGTVRGRGTVTDTWVHVLEATLFRNSLSGRVL